MGRFLFVLLFTLPFIAFVLNHEVVSPLLICGWALGVIPLLLLLAIDVLRTSSVAQKPWRHTIKIPIVVLGITSLLIGIAIVLWCIYNVFISRNPIYTGPDNLLELGLDGFGIASTLITFGWTILKLCKPR